MDIAAEGLDREAAYKLMMATIVPRPIAWVTSLSEDGRVNAAPFSCFCSVSNDPPMIGINIGDRGGELKDTARNILRAGEFVVNIADMPLLQPLHESARAYPAGVSEADELGLETSASLTVATPRIDRAPLQMECVLREVINFGHHSQFFVGLIQMFRVRKDLYDNGRIDTSALDPVARVGGPVYAQLGQFVRMRSKSE